MKTKEELYSLKEEVETVDNNPRELTDEELEQINGGSGSSDTPCPVPAPPRCFCSTKEFSAYCAPAECTSNLNCFYYGSCMNPRKKSKSSVKTQ